MAKNVTLPAEKREVQGTSASKRLRREGIVPGVIYGSSQREYMIQLNSKSFFDLARKQASHNFLVNLEIEGAEEKSKLAIVQDIQRDPLSGSLIHIDFRAVSETETINATVPIELVGEPVGVKSGGLLEQTIHEIEIFCRPGDLARKQASHNFLVNLEIEGAEEKSKLAIVQDIQRDPLSGSLIHIDFRAVSETETINATVPIELVGEPVGVKSGGLLEQTIHEIEIFCRPGDLPDAIVNDVEGLEIGDTLKVSDLNLLDGVTTKMGADVLVAVLAQTRAAASEGGVGEDGEPTAESAEGEGAEGDTAKEEGGDKS